MVMILTKQVLIMFLLILVGFFMFRKEKITMEGSKALGNILLYISLPSVIVKSFLVEKTSEMIHSIGFSMIAALLSLLIAMGISRVLFRQDGIAAFAGAFSNPGFFGIPLIASSVNEKAVIYIASYIAFLNLFQWSYGVMLLTNNSGKKCMEIKKLLLKMIKAPFMIAIVIGSIIFLSNWQIPSILKNSIGYLAGLNTPIAMFVVGVYLAQTDWKKMIRDRRLYFISLVKLLVVPFAVCILLQIFFKDTLPDMKTAILIASACPVGSNIAVYAQLYDSDYTYAVETVVVSTLLSVITIPFIMNFGIRFF